MGVHDNRDVRRLTAIESDIFEDTAEMVDGLHHDSHIALARARRPGLCGGRPRACDDRKDDQRARGGPAPHQRLAALAAFAAARASISCKSIASSTTSTNSRFFVGVL